MRPIGLRGKVALAGWGLFGLGFIGVFQTSMRPFWAFWSVLGAVGFVIGALLGRRWTFWALLGVLVMAYAHPWAIFQETIARFVGGHEDFGSLASGLAYAWDGLGFLLLAGLLRFLSRTRRPWALVTGAGLGILLLEGVWPKAIVWNWVVSWHELPLVPRAAAFLGARGMSVVLWMGAAAMALAIVRAVQEAEANPEHQRELLLNGTMRGLAGPGVVVVGMILLGVAWEGLPRGPEHSVDLLIVQPMIFPEGRTDATEMVIWTQTDTALNRFGLPRDGRPCLVAWPESALAGPSFVKGQVEGLARASKRGVTWTFGAMAVRGEGRAMEMRSVIHFYDPGVDRPQLYTRVDLFPWVEEVPGPAWFRDWIAQCYGQTSYLAGALSPDTSFRWKLGQGPDDVIRVHPLLCSEAMMPGRVQKGVAVAGADLLLNATNDAWLGDTEGSAIHGAHIAFRAVEMGVPLLRPTNSGLSGIYREDGSGELWGDPMRRDTFAESLGWRVVYTPMRHRGWSWFLMGLLVATTIVSLLPHGRRESL